jgi:hypothetical protein
MNKKIFAAAICIFLLNIRAAFPQTVLLQVDRAVDSLPSVRGPNLQKFSHFYFAAGFVLGADETGGKIIYGSSVNLAAGVRWKYKIGKVYSLGYETSFSYLDYKLDQVESKILPDTFLNDIERLDYLSFQLGFYNRFNFDPQRGNYMGYFLDLGIRGEWDYSIEHIRKNELPDGSEVKTSISALPYVNRLNYNLFARIGLNKLLMFVSYRMSDLFKSSYNLPETPRLIAGIELSIFRE